MVLDRRIWLLLGLLALGLVAYAHGLNGHLNLDALKERQASLAAWTSTNPIEAATAYFVGYVLVAALSLPGAAVLTLGAGATFGLIWGTVLASLASTLGATLAFLIARWVARDWVQTTIGRHLDKLNEGVARDGALYLFTLRLVPIVPFFVVNLAMGLTRLRTRTFLWVSQVGMLAGTLVYVNAGTQLARVDSLASVMSPALLASLAILGFFPLATRGAVSQYQKYREARKWKQPKQFDRNLVVIGAGSAGLVTAYIAAALRARVTIVEKHKMGGDCLNTGCVPSKALLRTTKFLSHVRRAKEFGARRADAEFDFATVMDRVQQVVRDIEPHDSVERYTALGVDVVQGHARLVSPWEVEITRADGEVQRLTTKSIVIATGARPTLPPIPGLDAANPLTSDNVWDLRELPRRLIVLGGGPIGCELSQAFARLGSHVTQVEMAPRLMFREDPDVSEAVARRFRQEGIDVRLGYKAVRVETTGTTKSLVVEHLDTQSALPFDAILVAVGRTPNLTGFGLEELGVRTQRTIDVNEFLQTNIPSIYAAGDVAGPFQFTHTAAHQAWYAAVNSLLSPVKQFRADYRVIPWATFTEPEVARVGLNETEAKAKGISYEVSAFSLEELDRAIADSEAHGFIKVLTVPGKDRILGVTIVGEHAGDLLAEYVLAMKHGLGLNKILGTIHTYPTLSEANKYVAGQWKRAHAPERLLRVVKRFHDWRRNS